VQYEDNMTLIRAGGSARNAGVRALFDGSGREMLRFFIHHGVSPTDAEDVLQDTFIKIIRGANSYSGQGNAQSWFWQVARNCMTDFLRKKGAYSERYVPFDDEHGNFPGSVAQSDGSGTLELTVDECVSNGIDAFAKDHADRAYALTLQMDGTSIEHIASVIGRTAAATKQYLSQCRKKLEPYVVRCTELLTS
jgi:RNA polymerase sigma factor (sigma-70 family)